MAEVIVSDHALVRYLERVLGLNIDSARWAIEHIARSAAPGASAVRSGGLTYVLGEHPRDPDGIAVVTIVEGVWQNRKAGTEVRP